MWAVDEAAPPPPGGLLADTPLALILGLVGGWLTAAACTAVGWVPAAVLGVASVTAAHGGLLVVALAWASADIGAPLSDRVLLLTLALVAAGACATALDPRAFIVDLAVPAWLAFLTWRGRLRGLGLEPRVPVRPLLAGITTGALLGGHLLLSASQTLGYALHGGGVGLLALWGYDAGANVISAECFFRGALFNRLERRWPFAIAAAVATAAALARYVLDPLLPKQIEVMAGALFYLTILGVVGCWLFWWSGSLVPGLAASWLFFLAYRLLAIR